MRDFLPSIEDLGRSLFFASEPIFSHSFFHLRPQASEMLAFAEMLLNDFEGPSRASASKNLHLLRVVASLPFKGSGEGVLNGFNRVGGAIIVY